MYAGVNPRINSSNAERDDIPEWKRVLIMKKRSSLPATGSEESKSESQTRSNFCGPLSSAEGGGGRRAASSDNLPAGHTNKFSMLRATSETSENEKVADSQPETVIRTIGNIKVELRSVYKSPAENGADDELSADRFLTSPSSEPVYPDSEEEEDLPYGPGIVDRLRSRFLNLGLKNRRKPAVRKFSSLENLSGGSGGMFRASGLQYRGERRFGARSVACGHSNQRLFPSSNFKKAQSMETLLVGGGVDANPFPSRRVNARIFSRNSRNHPSDKIVSPISRFSDSVPRFDGKRAEYNRQGSAPNINEDELPKPDTVKHFKRIFESPPTDKTCHVPVNQAVYEKGTHNRATSIVPSTSAATKTAGSSVSAKKPAPVTAQENVTEYDDIDAKSSAKIQEESSAFKSLNGSAAAHNEVESDELVPDELLSPEYKNEPEISRDEYLFIATQVAAPTIVEEPSNLSETDVNKESANTDQVSSQNNHVAEEEEESPVPKVTPERLPHVIESPSSNRDVESPQGSQVFGEPERAETNCVTVGAGEEPRLEVEEEDQESASSPTEMVIASSGVDGSQADEVLKPNLKKPNWQKPPPPTTSIVFDFRGKDVKPHISLNPAPFGCRPAKVKKRAGSPPRGETVTVNGDYSSDDDEDWDEMDIGADLPPVSGIVFTGENVKVGRGALLEKRNKKLTIQFNDEATSTYEYPCESPSPLEENGPDYILVETNSNLRPLKSSAAINNSSPFANTGLSNYTPHMISSEDFELGVSPPPPPIHRRLPVQPVRKCESPVPVTDEIVPADPDDSSGWSATETADILF